MALALSGIIFAGNYLFYSQLIKYRDRADTRLGKLLADRELPVLYRAREIIEPFAQEKQDARSVYQGTGLGMTIVKGLIDQMNGTIEVSSKEGVGSVFVITIPFEIAPPPEEMPAAEPRPEYSIRGLKLLMAEDNELNAE
ncbi:ATP-binding protein, partial [Butyribacter sp.]|uniref:ATP-binding protein n=1 Tax=Butyribacter sp. TaxID=2822465 RepID=UPI002A9BD726|nr:ATP-binding protein [Butyribacter sp.]